MTISVREFQKMSKTLRMKCPSCGYWNRVPVIKIFIEQNIQESKVKVFIPMYKPLQFSKCEMDILWNI